MNPVINAQLREYSKYNDLSTLAECDQFEIYSIFSTLNGHLGEDVDAFDVHLKGKEFGLDGIAILIQGEIVRNEKDAEDKLGYIKNPVIEFVFFQSKSGVSYDYGDVSKFYDAVNGFFDGDLNDESEAIKDCFSAKEVIYQKGIGKRNPKISCYYIATGNYDSPKRLEALKTTFIDEIKDTNIFDNDNITVSFVGAAELQSWYRTATSYVEVEIDFPRNVVMPDNKHVKEAYIGYINVENIVKLFTFYDKDSDKVSINRSVFVDNIRDYDADSKINLSIKDSVLETGGNDFVFRNNGVTVVARNIDRTGVKFRLEDFQIINGCQTSNVIFDLLYGEKSAVVDIAEKFKTIQVPLRLIGSDDDDFVSSIIIGTNRQNSVRDEQFWALRPFMKSLEEYCRNLESEEIILLERRDNQYKSQDVERTRIIQPSVLMKAVAACLLFQPQRAARDYRGIVSDYEQKIFLEGHDVRIYHAVAYLYYRMEFLWRNQKILSQFKTFRYYILAGIGLIKTRNRNVFSLKAKEIENISSQIVTLAKNEEDLTDQIVSIVEMIMPQITNIPEDNREKIRDTIRSEAFSAKFQEEIMKNF